MNEEKKGIEQSIFADYADRERRMISLAKSMRGDEPIDALIMQKMQPEKLKMLPTGPLVHQVKDASSFIRWVNWMEADPAKALIFWDEKANQITCFPEVRKEEAFPIDGCQDFGCLDRCIFKISMHQRFDLWLSSLHEKWSHKDLVKLFLRRQKDIVDVGELLQSWKKIKTAIDLQVESQYTNGFETTISYSSKTGSRTSESLLTEFKISIPLLSASKEGHQFDIMVEIDEPKVPGAEAFFTLISPDLEDGGRFAIESIVEELEDELDDFKFIHGVGN